jgi:hypothetical protein
LPEITGFREQKTEITFPKNKIRPKSQVQTTEILICQKSQVSKNKKKIIR